MLTYGTCIRVFSFSFHSRTRIKTLTRSHVTQLTIIGGDILEFQLRILIFSANALSRDFIHFHWELRSITVFVFYYLEILVTLSRDEIDCT